MSNVLKGTAGNAYALDVSTIALRHHFQSPLARWADWNMESTEDRRRKLIGNWCRRIYVLGRISGVELAKHVPRCVVELTYERFDRTAPWDLVAVFVHASRYSVPPWHLENIAGMYAPSQAVFNGTLRREQRAYYRDGYLPDLPCTTLLPDM